MGLRISLDTDNLSRADAVTIARLLESASPGVLAEVLGAGHTETLTVKLDASDVTAALDTLAAFPAPDAPAGAVPVPPAPPSGVVSATPPAPAASPAAADRDVNGLPWDGRIHSSPRKQNADGSWRAKRGVDDALVASVTAELRQNAAAPVVPVTVTAVSGPGPMAVGDVVTGVPVPPPPPPAPAAAPALSGPQLFARYMERVTAAQTSGLVTTADVASIATGLGLVGTAGLLQRPDLVPQAEAALDALLASRTA